MAGEFRIKTGLLLGPQPTQPVISIQDTSSSITTDASSILVTAKAIYDFHTANAPESYWTLDGSTLVPKDESVDVQLSAIQIDTDAGAVTVIDMDVSSATASTEESYAFNIDGTAIAKIYAEGDGVGGIQEAAFKVLEAFYSESSVYFSGIPDLSTSYVLFYNPTTDQVTYASESAISGVTQLSALTDVSIGGTIPDGSVLVYNSALGKWTYGAQITSVDWGDINGSISDQTDLSTWITNLSNDIDDVSSRTDDVETSIGTLNGLIQTNISDISNIETSLGTLNGLIQTNISDISNIETSLGTLNGLIQTNISDISNIETSLGTLNGLIQTNISDISNLETSVYTVLNQRNINQDISIAAISTAQGNYVLKTGDTMTGNLTSSAIIRANAIIADGTEKHPSIANGYVELYMYNNGGTWVGRMFAYTGSAYKDLAIGDWNSGNPNIMLKVGGNVGIGKGSPGYKLDVAGSLNFDGSLYQNGALFSGGTGDVTKLYVDGSLAIRDSIITAINASLGDANSITSYVNSSTYYDGSLNAKANKNTFISYKTSAYTLASTDNNCVIEASGTFGIYLPTNLDTGFQALIMNVGGGTITINASTGATVYTRDSSNDLTKRWTGATVYKRSSSAWAAMGDLQ